MSPPHAAETAAQIRRRRQDPFRPTRRHPHRGCAALHTYTVGAVVVAFVLTVLEGGWHGLASLALYFAVAAVVLGLFDRLFHPRRSSIALAAQAARDDRRDTLTGHRLRTRPVWCAVALMFDGAVATGATIVLGAVIATLPHPATYSEGTGTDIGGMLIRLVPLAVGFGLGDLAHRLAVHKDQSPVIVVGRADGRADR